MTARYRAEQAGHRVTYAVLHARWFVVSGTEAGRIFYQKTVYDPQAGRFATLLLRYPGQNTAVAAQVAPLARSLRFGP